MKVYDLHDLMFKAIIENKVEFVELFIENGCQMSEILTYRRLVKLYNTV